MCSAKHGKKETSRPMEGSETSPAVHKIQFFTFNFSFQLCQLFFKSSHQGTNVNLLLLRTISTHMTKFSTVKATELLTCLSNIHGLSSTSIGDACASLLIGRGMDMGMELVCRGFRLLWGMSRRRGRSDVSKLSIAFSHSSKLEDLVFI